MTFANDKITITAERETFNLFSHENDSWTENVVAFRDSSHFIHSNFEPGAPGGVGSEQLITVRNLKADR